MKKYLHPDHTILIAGAGGMVGRSLTQSLKANNYNNLLIPTRSELDYTQQIDVRKYLSKHKPDVVVIAAAKVGGIYANMSYPAEFIYNNLMIAANLIHESHRAGVDRLLYLGSTCIYPRETVQPISEEALLTGPLEKTNEAYALAKIAGLKLCQFYRAQYGRNYITAMPTNLYGPNDSYHRENSHVIPALIRRFHEAKVEKLQEVSMWGSGKVQREFLYVDDLARACLLLLETYAESSPINIGSHEEITICKLAEMVADVVGYQGNIINDLSKPDGIPRKKADITRIMRLGWEPKIPLREGLKLSYRDFLNGVAISNGAS